MVKGRVENVPDDGLSTKARRNRPLVVVHTGPGKGKSTAAFGLALRGWNQGFDIGVFQFVKSAKWRIGEQTVLERLGELHRETGEGGPVEPFAPLILFALLFGLSMDYQVFLVSRIAELYHGTKDNAVAVRRGLAEVSRVIIAAASIMVVVFGSFVSSDSRIMKLLGLGLAVAVFVDAFIVRVVLVPAIMRLLGRANWWMPAWLDRILPHLDIDGDDHAVAGQAVGQEKELVEA